VLGRGWVGGLVCRVRREDRYCLVRLRSYVVSMRLFCNLVCLVNSETLRFGSLGLVVRTESTMNVDCCATRES